jgi:hypothetical protein
MTTTNDPRRDDDREDVTPEPRPSSSDQQGVLGRASGCLNVLTFGMLRRRDTADRRAYDSEPVHAPPDVERGYEVQDFSPRLFGRLAVGFIILSIVGGALLFVFFGALRGLISARDQQVPALQTQPQAPPAPRLQVSPPGDMDVYRRREEQLLSQYQWVSQEQGIVRIPIERAMQLTLERGLPARQQPPSETSRLTGTDYDQTQDLDSEGGVPPNATVAP